MYCAICRAPFTSAAEAVSFRYTANQLHEPARLHQAHRHCYERFRALQHPEWSVLHREH